MRRSHTFQPAVETQLESRVVLSQVYFSPVTGVIDSNPAAVGSPRQGRVVMTHSVIETKFDAGTTRRTDTSIIPDGAAGTLTSQIIHEPDGTTETTYETASTSNGTETFTRAIILPDGTRQTETGTNQTVPSATMILNDGTLVAKPGSTLHLSRTTTFHHVITQPGLGTETIDGTSVQGLTPRGTMTVSNQRVTHFDGTQDQVKLVTTGHSGTSTTRETITPPDGATTTTVRTTKLLFATHP